MYKNSFLFLRITFYKAQSIEEYFRLKLSAIGCDIRVIATAEQSTNQNKYCDFDNVSKCCIHIVLKILDY